MIEITDGFTSVSAGSDRIDDLAQGCSGLSGDAGAARPPTGARVVVEFSREMALAAGQRVTVRFCFAGDGTLREGIGVARPIRTVVRWGRSVRYHYRVSYWIAPAELMNFVTGKVRSRASEPKAVFVDAARAIYPTPA